PRRPAAAAGVLPWLWEGLPLTRLEALARARPVAASAVGGIPEVIEDRVSGRLVPPGDVAALTEALEWLHRRADLAAALGREGAAGGGARHTRDRGGPAVGAGYREVPGRGRLR